MRSGSRTTTHGLLLAGALALGACAAAEDDPRLARSRDAATALQTALGERLSAAIATGGPVAAIAVCQEDAPGIAARLSAATGARIGRTATKWRNPGNAPDAAAQTVLAAFERRLAAGEAAPLERFETDADGGARYYRTIVTQPMCLVCHGATLAPDVAAAIAARYPDDRATGFAAGDLRGAFVVEWPSSSTRTESKRGEDP